MKKISGKEELYWVAFSATIKGVPVRLTAGIEELSILTRDNAEEYRIEDFAHLLKDIEYEDIY